MRAERYGGAVAGWSQTPPPLPPALVFGSGSRQGRLSLPRRFACAQERPTLPPSPPSRARGALAALRRVAKRPAGRPTTLFRWSLLMSLLLRCARAHPGLFVVSLLAVCGLSVASRRCACRAPAPSFGRAITPYGQSGWGCRPPFFSAGAHTGAPPLGGFPVRAARARVFPAARCCDCPPLALLIYRAYGAASSGAKMRPHPPTTR